MKVTITMTKREKSRILDQLSFDPCGHIECANIECERCPLHEEVNNLREVLDNFHDVISAISEEGE